MGDRILEFETLTGKIMIDLEECFTCQTKACVDACAARIFRRDGDGIALNMDQEKIKRGGCTETTACELECQRRGRGALRLVLPMPEFDRYVEEARKQDLKLIF
jgi:ferredoxin-like protein FixX